MTNAAFKLQDSGFTREQVEALSDFLDGRSATKADVTALRSELKDVETRLTGEINSVRGDINLLRSEMKWTRWMIGVCIALIVAVLVKLLF